MGTGIFGYNTAYNGVHSPIWKVASAMRAMQFKRRPALPRPVMTLAGALWEEFEAIHGEAEPASGDHAPEARLNAYCAAALAKDQAALCLSGGGIRSAAYCLGIMQGLARLGLLDRFHYLSTVSGGGYIGGWLSALLKEHGGDAARVQELLTRPIAPTELHNLRSFTSFLSPRLGLASPDSWAGIVLWVRNTLVNWLIFVPAFFALALLPGLYAAWIGGIGVGLSGALLPVALICLGIAIYNAVGHSPSAMVAGPMPRRRSPGFVPLGVVLPYLTWSGLVPLVAAPWLRQIMPPGAVPGDAIPLLYIIVSELVYIAVTFREQKPGRKFLWHNFGWWTLATLVSAAILWVALDLGIGRGAAVIAVLGPVAVMFAHLLHSLIFVAFRTEALRGDLDREWIARLSGQKTMPALLWAIFASVCLLLPGAVENQKVLQFLGSGYALATGPVAAFLGKISKGVPGEGGAGKSRFTLSLDVVIAVLAAIFAAALFMLLAKLGARLTGGDAVAYLVAVALAGVLAWACGRHIDVNRFSMHAVYRTRLVRAFLGTARTRRAPDDFTDIDPSDNLRMSALSPKSPAKQFLFHVINVTLNLASGRNTAWSERKGESFTITPVACGAAFLQKHEDAVAGNPVRGAYVKTKDYAGGGKETGPEDKAAGLTLGTALTLSGAAVSPSMGYHSSPAAAFLMTLFNVRLGAWLPNPAVATVEQLCRAKPPNTLVTLALELLGQSDERGSAVYLSDGGHFEDLGLYEMVRRRCRYVFVVDAGRDEQATFNDLGNAVRKIAIDLDIRIDFDPPVAIGSRDKPVSPFRSFACATIRYPESPIEGRLIYIRPCDPPGAPIDVRAYRNTHDDFPHESTIDQFFSESQFESYRRLGENEAASLAFGGGSLGGFFQAACAALNARASKGAGDAGGPENPCQAPTG